MKEEILNNYRSNCYKRFTKPQIEDVLLFLDAIQYPDGSHVAFVKKHKELIESLVEKGCNGGIDRYDLYNDSSKYLPKKIKHPYSQVLRDVVWYRVGEQCQKNGNLSLKEIGERWENCGVDFFLGYVPSNNTFKRLTGIYI